jgi:hypothetical protein
MSDICENYNALVFDSFNSKNKIEEFEDKVKWYKSNHLENIQQIELLDLNLIGINTITDNNIVINKKNKSKVVQKPIEKINNDDLDDDDDNDDDNDFDNDLLENINNDDLDDDNNFNNDLLENIYTSTNDNVCSLKNLDIEKIKKNEIIKKIKKNNKLMKKIIKHNEKLHELL